jgi:nitrate/nitrite transporter NarK
MFILEGAPAVLLGLICLVYLDDRPAAAQWLDPAQRDWLMARLEAEQSRAHPVPRQALWRVLTNGRVLALAVVLAGTTANSSGLQLWTPQIIKSFGLSNMQTGLVNAIPFAIAAIAMVWWGRRSDRVGERVWHTVLPLALIAVSLAAFLLFHSLIATVVIFCLAVVGIYACKGPVWAVSTEWLAASVAAAGLAQINAISNLAGFGTIWVVGAIKQATGGYTLAMLPLVGLAAVSALTMAWVGRGTRQA